MVLAKCVPAKFLSLFVNKKNYSNNNNNYNTAKQLAYNICTVGICFFYVIAERICVYVCVANAYVMRRAELCVCIYRYIWQEMKFAIFIFAMRQ
jgi:hypothetical protein